MLAFTSPDLRFLLSQDEHALQAANNIIKDSGSEIEKLRGELQVKESTIEKEEAELDRIRDSLKGTHVHSNMRPIVY